MRVSASRPPTGERTRLLVGAAATVVAVAALVAAGCRQATHALPPAPQVVVTDVVQKDIPIYSEWVGTTDGFVNAQIRPKVQGYLVKQTYKDGSHVTAGELLFRLDDREYEAALQKELGDLAERQAEFTKHQNDVGRYTPLAAQGAVSRQELDDAIQATRASQAQVEAAEAAVENAKLNLGWTEVYSPIDGIAGIAQAQVGDLVGPGTLLTTVSQLDPIKVTFPINEQEYLRFAERIKEHEEKGRARNEPQIEMILADGSTYKYPGHFYVANRQVDVQTGTIQIQGIFPNPEDILRPGQYAKVRAATEIRHGALLVPQRAVLETQGQYQVAVVGPDEKVTFRGVTPGPQVGSAWIIDAGLTAGDRVITEGIQKVQDGMLVRTQPAAASNAAALAVPPAPTAMPKG